MHQIIIHDVVIDIIRKKIKNMYLGVYPPQGRVRMTVPEKLDLKTIQLFALSKLAWIKKRKIKFDHQVQPLSLEYISGENYFFLGKKYQLNMIHNLKKKTITLRDEFIDVHIDMNSDKSDRQKKLTLWCRKQLKERIMLLAECWEKTIGVKASEYRIKQMKTRWGTCSIKAKRIWINLELIKMPIQCLEYILVHELVHLLERRHNARFKAYMDKYLPNWRDTNKILKQFSLSIIN